MSLMLPAPLVTVLNNLNIKWPEGDEGKTFEYAKKWQEMGDRVQALREEGDASAQHVLEANRGENAEAFRTSMTASDGPAKTAGRASTGLKIGGAVLILAAAAILALKVYAIVQLAILLVKELAAIAAAPSTFGASLKMIPVFRMLAKAAIEAVIGKTMTVLEG